MILGKATLGLAIKHVLFGYIWPFTRLRDCSVHGWVWTRTGMCPKCTTFNRAAERAVAELVAKHVARARAKRAQPPIQDDDDA